MCAIVLHSVGYFGVTYWCVSYCSTMGKNMSIKPLTMLRYINFFCSLFIRKAVKNNYGRFSYAFSICFIIYAADDVDGGGVADAVWHCHSLI